MKYVIARKHKRRIQYFNGIWGDPDSGKFIPIFQGTTNITFDSLVIAKGHLDTMVLMGILGIKGSFVTSYEEKDLVHKESDGKQKEV
ncbi:MAG: hypothetical protein J6I84_04470 [Bacilli bacterium]|nr:hypothetical protein [Bacilli bacterium]